MANLGYIQLNRTCNQNCLFCSNPENGNVLNFNQAKYYIDDFIKSKVDGIIFTGGEPTLNKALPDLLKYCQDQGLESRIITNGQLTADFNFLNELKKAGLSLMHVSVHSVNPKIQDNLSQTSDSFKNIIKTLINAQKLNVAVNLNTVINSKNAKSLDRNIKFFVRKFPEISHYIFNNLDPRMNRVESNKYLVPQLIDFKKSLNHALAFLSKYNKSFRVERVPLCYMLNYSHYSTETRKIIKGEGRTIIFLDDREDSYSKQNYFFYQKAKQCKKCSLESICAGLYAMGDYFSEKELMPQDISAKLIIDKVKKYD